MFYSRELLARKASLGQIWLLGTKQSKLDRRKASKLDVAQLCEEILYPPVPIALRLSSILMGGVVILYEKKVMLLHDDANRLLVELRNAWKVMDEPTLLPKTRTKAGRKTITLPENEDTNVGEPEDEETSMRFQQNNHNMRLDQVDEYYFFNDPMEDNLNHDHHQADDNDITLFDSFQPNTHIHDQFERFEEGDGETQLNVTLEEYIEIPTTPVPSPAQQDGPQRAEETQEQHLENQLDQQLNKNQEARDQQRPGPVRRKARKAKGIAIDEEQITLPNHVYLSWLHDTSDIVSRRGRKRRRTNILSTLKIAELMELPSTVLMDDTFAKGNQDIPYPAPLLDLWKKSTQPHNDSPSVRTLQPRPPESSPPDRVQYDNPMDYPFEDLHSGVGSPSYAATIELQRTSMVNKVTPLETNQFVTPGNSGDAARYTGSSVSGDGIPTNNLDVNIGRIGSKKNIVPSTSKNSTGSLDPVVEVFREADIDYKLSSPGPKNLTPDQSRRTHRLLFCHNICIISTGICFFYIYIFFSDLLVETQLTMEVPANDPPDIMTENIRKYLYMKAHFETPGAPQVESLNNLAAGLTRKGAAQLFYQTCVLTSQGLLKVEQKDAFGDILISKGPKM
ncbi:sister chromatid cohesion 1 protein 1 [Herrania umbratica]|uniref:Sister chromatid cohesion 1 protein 1 n=1 Tax=Herrania umbratica TaxID=108875 RepID=A0A6J1B9P8_9ROSI|nr:sister chromatid cohesion 1 protein 1 [Herrania umbratica]